MAMSDEVDMVPNDEHLELEHIHRSGMVSFTGVDSTEVFRTNQVFFFILVRLYGIEFIW